jgi:hypothetical protein
MRNEDEWAKLKVRRMASIRYGIDTLRENAEPKLRKYRHGKLHGQINELRIVELFTSEEARELNSAVNEANRLAFKEEQAAEDL